MGDTDITDTVLVIYHTWNNLDVALLAITPIIRGETWQSFCGRVRQNESAAHRSWGIQRGSARNVPARRDFERSSGNNRFDGNNRFNNDRPTTNDRRASNGRLPVAGERPNRVEKTRSPKKASPKKEPARPPLNNTTGNRGRK